MRERQVQDADVDRQQQRGRGRRSTEVTDPTLEMLRSHMARQAERMLGTGHRMTDDHLDFCDAAGERLWGRHLTTLRLKGPAASGSRRSASTTSVPPFAMLRLAGGTNAKVVSEVLGHKEVAITLDR